MALERGRLSTIVQVSAGSTVGIITVADNKKVYVKSIITHGVGLNTAPDAHVYYVPNGGSFGDDNKLFHVTLNAGESAMIEPSYPIVLTETGDSLRVGAGKSTVNVLILGDKEV